MEADEEVSPPRGRRARGPAVSAGEPDVEEAGDTQLREAGFPADALTVEERRVLRASGLTDAAFRQRYLGCRNALVRRWRDAPGATLGRARGLAACVAAGAVPAGTRLLTPTQIGRAHV